MSKKESVVQKEDAQLLIELQDYIKVLYEAYDVFQVEYRRLHKRSKLHNKETMAEYYLRWRDKMRMEIRRIEALLLKLIPTSCSLLCN